MPWFALLFWLYSLVVSVRSDCAEPRSFEATFAAVPVVLQVVRSPDNATIHTDCNLGFFRVGDEYVPENEFALYEIVKVYKEDYAGSLRVGGAIPMVWSTDTGYTHVNESSTEINTVDPVLLFLYETQVCNEKAVMPANETTGEKVQLYHFSECDVGVNKYLSALTDHEAAFLDRVVGTFGSVGGTDTTSSSTTASATCSQMGLSILVALATTLLLA